MKLKELKKLCARHDELETRINISIAQSNRGTAVKDDPAKLESLQIKLNAIEAKILGVVNLNK